MLKILLNETPPHYEGMSLPGTPKFIPWYIPHYNRHILLYQSIMHFFLRRKYLS